MAVSILTNRVIGNGNGSATTFSFSDIIISQSSDLVVTKRDANGTETVLTEGTGTTNYSVSVSSYPGTGSITYPATLGTKLASGESVAMKSVRALTQGNDLNNQGGYFADTQETMFDKLTYITQQIQEELDRAVKIPVTDVSTTLATLQANIISLAAIEANITTVAGISANVTTVAGISSDVTTVAGIASDVTTAAEVGALSFKYLFDNTTSMADPGSGDVRYNNATPASVTNIAISNTYSGGSDISDFIASWDDVANAGTRAHLVIKKANTAGTFQVFKVTGAITDNTTWLQIPVTHVAGTTLPTDGDSLYVGMAFAGADGSGDLVAANNLSDVASAATSRSNLGLEIGVDVLAESDTSIGKHALYIDASYMRPTVTSGGPAMADAETTAGRPDISSRDLDGSVDEALGFKFAMPKSWNAGTITYKVHWSTDATDADGVAFGLEAVSVADGDTIDVAFGTAIVVTDDAQSAAEDNLVTAESSALTVASATKGAMTYFRLYRDVSDANDDMTEDAKILGVTIFITTDAGEDT